MYCCSFVVFCFIVLLIMKSEFISAAPNRGKSVAKRDRLWKSKKQECESNECGRFIPEEAYNCVNNCTSNVCYQEIYALEPLEDGEIDHERNGKFVACVRKEYSNVDKSDMKKVYSQGFMTD